MGLCFATGFAMRLQVANREERLARAQLGTSEYVQGTRVASVGLEGAGNIDFKPIGTLYEIAKDLEEALRRAVDTQNRG